MPLKPLTKDEIRAALGDYPPIITPAQLAEITGISRSTVYQWIAQDRLKGALRRRGKHVLIWRDRAVELLFNGPRWEDK